MAVEAAEICKLLPIGIVVTKTVFSHHSSQQYVVRAHLSMQTTHHSGTFRKSRLDCIQFFIESLLLFYTGPKSLSQDSIQKQLSSNGSAPCLKYLSES